MTPGRKGPAQTGERGRYLWVPVGENGLLGAELTCCVSRSTHPYKGVPTNPRLSAVRRPVWYSCVFVLRFDAPPSFLRNFPAWHSREKSDVHLMSHMVGFIGHKPRVPDTAISPTSSPLALRPHARRSRRDTVRKFLSKLPARQLGRQVTTLAASETFLPKFNGQGLHVSPESRVPDRLNCASWDRVPHIRPWNWVTVHLFHHQRCQQLAGSTTSS